VSTDPLTMRLLGDVHATVTARLPHDADGAGLLLRASEAAAADLPGELGTAVAAVLRVAWLRRVADGGGMSVLGMDNSILALALAVLGPHEDGTPP
jgi:hypothetical protein